MSYKKTAIYVASRVAHAPDWRSLREQGYPIISTWIDEACYGETKELCELWGHIRSEIVQCTAFVFLVRGMNDFPFKSALVEVGMALALGKHVFVALENVVLQEGRTTRPIGSWVRDKNVYLMNTRAEALLAALLHDSGL